MLAYISSRVNGQSWFDLVMSFTGRVHQLCAPFKRLRLPDTDCISVLHNIVNRLWDSHYAIIYVFCRYVITIPYSLQCDYQSSNFKLLIFPAISIHFIDKTIDTFLKRLYCFDLSLNFMTIFMYRNADFYVNINLRPHSLVIYVFIKVMFDEFWFRSDLVLLCLYW